MACFVTGIVPTENITELEQTLGVDGLDAAKLTVITKAEQSDEHDSSFLNFIHAGGPRIDSDAMGGLAGTDSAIMTGSGGTGVPGMSTARDDMGFLFSDHVVRRVGTLPIPDDEAENYNDAIADGRCVVAYECSPADSAKTEDLLRQAGVRRVKTFTSPA